MQRKRDGSAPIGEVFNGLNGLLKTIREGSPQARHHFTRFDRGSDSNGAKAHAKRRFPDSLGVGDLALDP